VPFADRRTSRAIPIEPYEWIIRSRGNECLIQGKRAISRFVRLRATACFAPKSLFIHIDHCWDNASLHPSGSAVIVRIVSTLVLVGAEGFEVSVPSGHYAIFFVEFNSQTALYQEPAGITKLLPVSQLSHQWTTFRKNLVSLVSLLSSIVQFGRERTGDVPVDSSATIPGPWHRLRQCGRCYVQVAFWTLAAFPARPACLTPLPRQALGSQLQHQP
jgi:hypothetical protein